MVFNVTHRTTYNFSAAIFPEPHYLRFKPRTAPHQRLLKFNISIGPEPAGISEIFDVEDNLVHHCWFNDMTDRLDIVAEFTLESLEFNPFNFLLDEEAHNDLPVTYPGQMLSNLHPYLETEALAGPMAEYVNTLREACGNQTLPFLSLLTRQIHADCTLEYREEGVPLEPAETLQRRSGSCRDLTWLQIRLLRGIGIAARFVSGYYFIASDQPSYELHAWLEVYLPGAGWKGFDPSHGIAVANHHLAVSASSHYLNTMPVTGSIRGAADSRLETHLTIEKLNSELKNK